MMRTYMILILSIVYIICIHNITIIDGYCSSHQSKSTSSKSSSTLTARSKRSAVVLSLKSNNVNDDSNRSNRRIIRPSDIDDMFRSKNQVSASTDDDEDDDDEDDDDDITDYTDEVDGDMVPSSLTDDEIDESNYNKIMSRNNGGGNVATINELTRLESMMSTGFSVESKIDNAYGGGSSSNGNIMTPTPTSSNPSTSTADASIVDDNLGYIDLDEILDVVKGDSTSDILSMIELESNGMSSRRVSSLMSSSSSTTTSSSIQAAPRAVIYTPAPSVRGDPMNYGAYRRSQVVVEPKKSKGGKKGKQINGGSKSSDTKKSGGGIDTDKFYNALKKLGSGPKSSGMSTGTGLSDPPKSKKSIQPNKSPSGKNKKRIVTPNDINSLFGSSDNSNEDDAEVDVSNDYDDDANTSTEGINRNIMSQQQNNQMEGTIDMNSLLVPSDEMPQWIIDADKEAKKKKQLAGKKPKKLTDDWRFWIGIIVTIGFSTALFTTFQHTGSFNTGGLDTGGLGIPQSNIPSRLII